MRALIHYSLPNTNDNEDEFIVSVIFPPVLNI
jgi:hypothetical protein